MPLDGIVINALVHEFNEKLVDGKIDKIYQPQKDELVLLIRNKGQNYRLLMSAASNNPRVHITDTGSDNPQTPPMFCMLMRKHLGGGRIIAVEQPNFERIIQFSIESYNELGDLIVKKLMVEIMGRHSNIILVNHDGKIIDSIKHIDVSVSSVRQVLPGLPYTFPPSQDKRNPLTSSKEEIAKAIGNQREGIKVDKSIVNSFTGVSPLIGREICHRALPNPDDYVGKLGVEEINHISVQMYNLFEEIRRENFAPVLLYDQGQKNIIDFSAVPILQYGPSAVKQKSSISKVLDCYYATRANQERLKQKGADLIRIVNTNLERCKKKLSIQQEKLTEVANKEQYKILGDLITANIYRISQGMKSVEVENFYEEGSPMVKIPLDVNLPPSKNAQKYFNKYTKAKNAEIIVNQQMELNLEEIKYLESIQEAISKAETVQELNEIREELHEQGYIKRSTKAKKQAAASKPRHFTSSDGFDIYVGKNNKQNDYLSMKFARSNDIWFHTKTIPGSHVILKTDNHEHIPDTTLLEASMLAAFYSKGSASSNVAVDYTKIKNVKKPSGAKPGMVIYENYKTIYVTPQRELVEKLEKK